MYPIAQPLNQPLNRFVNVTEAQIAAVLQPLGFMKVDLPDTAEVTFSRVIQYEGAPTIVRVYTAVLKATGQSRGPGKDAIRVCLGRAIALGSELPRVRIFKTLLTVQRRGTWAVQLLQRLGSIGDGLAKATPTVSEIDLLEGRSAPAVGAPVNGQALACPACGSRMVGPKPSKRGAFYGCSRFPVCRGARNLDGSVSD